MARGRGTFGLSSTHVRGRGSFRAGFRGGGSWRGRGRGRGGSKATGDAAPRREDDGTQLAERFEKVALNDEIDEKLGFARVQEGMVKEGWLVNMHPVSSPSFCSSMMLTLALEDSRQRRRLAVWKSRR